ncbi:MAG TPA: DUF2079 domain-containing protein [Polyangia bacterium]|jgi:uncharacterized membrane protein|nr:DUF2079 domain-containing protein [Polyangia bacterium]
MAVVLRALTLLGLTGASLALFVQELVGDWVRPFVSANVMTMHNRTRLLVGMVAGAAAAILVGLLVLWRKDTRRLARLAHLLSPLILIGLVPQLTDAAAWSSPLNVGLVLGGYVLLAERLFRIAWLAVGETPPGSTAVADGYPPWWQTILPPRLRRRLPVLLVIAGALAYGVYFSVFTIRMHGRFQTYNFDLGQYDNLFWNLLHGHPLRMSPLGLDKNWTDLRNHADLSVFFFIPFYALRPGATTLLMLQSFVLGLGAIPVYRFAARRMPRGYAALITFCYLCYPPMHGMQFYDFHMQPIASTFVLFVIDFVDERRYWLCALAFAIAITCREDISVGLAILGAFLMLTGYRLFPGLVISVVASIYFVLLRFVIMPSFGGWGFQDIYKELFPQGAPNFGGVIATLVSNPLFTLTTLLTTEKLRYALQILVPLAFLPIRKSYLAVSLVSGSIFTLLTTKYPPTIDIGFQYSAHFFPYLFSALSLVVAGYGPEGDGLVKRRAALTALVTATIFAGVFWGAIPPRNTVHGGFSMMTMQPPTAADRQKDKYIKELHAMVPSDASLGIGEAEMTHVSHLRIKGLRDSMDVDYILYSPGSGGDRALTSGEYEKIAERPGSLILLKRRAKGAVPPPGSPTQPILTAPPVPAAPPTPPPPTAPAWVPKATPPH